MTHARSEERRFTFAVVGRDEARTMAGVIDQATHAAGPGDEVWFVDSASRDDSLLVAGRLGVEIIKGGEGKGRAMAAALARCRTSYICFLDADLYSWEMNIPAALREAILASGADMVVGSFVSNRRRMITPMLYWPLVDALFPECGRLCDPRPLSGLRVISTGIELGELPDGYGVETYLNLFLGAAGARIVTTDLGAVRDPLRGYANLEAVGEAVIETILDLALAEGRLELDERARLEAWARDLLGAMVGASDQQRRDPHALAARHPLPRLKA